MKHFKSSQIHPGAWWLLGFACAFAAGASRNPIFLIALSVSIVVLILLFREQNPWSQSLRFYLGLSFSIIAIRIVFRIIFNYGVFDLAAGSTLIDLPQLTLNLGILGSVNFFGQVSTASLANASIDGLRMSGIVMSLGLANSLANPRRLLKATPGALYEVASAMAIAINLAPQLISSAKRVNRARQLRGRSKGVRTMRSLVVPILEDTIEKSLSLAASMDTRGFGRRSATSAKFTILTRFLSFVAIASTASGSYLLLSSNNLALSLSLIAAGVLSALAVIRASNFGLIRTQYAKTRWRWNDFCVLVFAASIVGLSSLGIFK